MLLQRGQQAAVGKRLIKSRSVTSVSAHKDGAPKAFRNCLSVSAYALKSQFGYDEFINFERKRQDD